MRQAVNELWIISLLPAHLLYDGESTHWKEGSGLQRTGYVFVFLQIHQSTISFPFFFSLTPPTQHHHPHGHKWHAHTCTHICALCLHYAVDRFCQARAWSQMRGIAGNKYFCTCEGVLLSARRNARITWIESDCGLVSGPKPSGLRAPREQMNYLIVIERNPRRTSISFQLAACTDLYNVTEGEGYLLIWTTKKLIGLK